MPRGICDVSLEYTHIYFRGDLFPGAAFPTGRRLSHGALPRTPSAFLKESGAKNLLFFDIAGSFIFGEIGIEKNKEQKKRCCIR